jgi:sRNA-binding carbon storage regulator CsrA
MLIITRRVGETFLLYPDSNLDPRMTVAELFAEGPLKIGVFAINGGQARIGIDAPISFHVTRSEIQTTTAPRLTKLKLL